MQFIPSDKVSLIISNCPKDVSDKLKQVRQLIIETAQENGGLSRLIETTKWGEPSYVSKTGSTVRMGWKPKTPDKYYLYFICSTQLVPTFRFIFGESLVFEGERAIVLDLHEDIPVGPLKRCLSLALNYHKIKHLPMLGV